MDKKKKETEVISVQQYCKSTGYSYAGVLVKLSRQALAGKEPQLPGVISMSKFGNSWALTVLKPMSKSLSKIKKGKNQYV